MTDQTPPRSDPVAGSDAHSPARSPLQASSPTVSARPLDGALVGAVAADEAPPPLSRPPWSLILLLASVTALGPFAMQAIAPALPAMAEGMAISASAAQSLISAAMLGMAAGAVVYGPLADHYGRRPVLLVGLLISAAGAAVAFVAPVFELALLGRVAQAVGSGAGMVLARAVAQDLFGARSAASVIAQITGVMVVAPMLAPGIGGVLTELVGWRGIFGAVAVLSIGLYLWVRLRFQETARHLTPRLELGGALSDYRAIVRRPVFQAHAAFSAAMLSSFFLFVSGGPYVLDRAYGVGPGIYGVMFVVAAAVYMAANFASPAVTRRLGHEQVLRLGALFACAGCLGVGLFLWAWGARPLAEGEVDWVGGGAMMLVVVLHAVGTGLATPNGIAGAIAAYPERAGSASSLVSVAQFSAGALAAQAATLLPLDRGGPLALGMAALTLSAYAAFALLRPRAGRE